VTPTLLAIIVVAAAVGASIAWFLLRGDRDADPPASVGSAIANPEAPPAAPAVTGPAAAAVPQPADSPGSAAIAGSGTAAPPAPEPTGSAAPAPEPAPPSPGTAPPSQ
jgi:2-oxoglutarate dehydrogenase E2 component (dihydrolipoamide succinyltransferase)